MAYHAGFKASQTLIRAFDIVDAVAEGCNAPADIAHRLSIGLSTAYRLARLMVERGHLHEGPDGLQLGPRLMALGAIAERSIDLTRMAQPLIDDLAKLTSDAVSLAARQGDEVVYLAQARGARRLDIRHRVGDRDAIYATAMGQALMMDAKPSALLDVGPSEPLARQAWVDAMAHARRRRVGVHRSGPEQAVVCIAAPIRAASHKIIAAVGLTTLQQYLTDARAEDLRRDVAQLAFVLSQALGARDPLNHTPDERMTLRELDKPLRQASSGTRRRSDDAIDLATASRRPAAQDIAVAAVRALR